MLALNRRKDHCEYYFEDGTAMPAPNSIQIQGAVRKADPRYRIRPKQTPRWLSIVFHALAGLFVIALVLGAWAIVFYVVSEWLNR